MRESKSLALPLGDAPMERTKGTGVTPIPLSFVGWVMGLEPTTPGTTIRCSAIELHPPHIRTESAETLQREVARQKGLEPLAYCLEGSCSIQLSYWRM